MEAGGGGQADVAARAIEFDPGGAAGAEDVLGHAAECGGLGKAEHAGVGGDVAGEGVGGGEIEGARAELGQAAGGLVEWKVRGEDVGGIGDVDADGLGGSEGDGVAEVGEVGQRGAGDAQVAAVEDQRRGGIAELGGGGNGESAGIEGGRAGVAARLAEDESA